MGDLLGIPIGPRCGMRRGTSATAWYERGCALEATDPSAARSAYERAATGRPDLADAHNNLGRIHHEGHGDALDLVAAEGCYRLAICVDPRVALYWFNLGVAVEDQGRIAEAIAAYEHALALDASFADAHFNVARLYEAAARRRSDDILLCRAVRHLVRYRDLAAASSR